MGHRFKTAFLLLLGIVTLAYIAGAVTLALRDDAIPVFEARPADYATIAIFGASGTAGDGILEAALSNPEVDKVHVVTRRITPRMQEGIDAGKVQATLHTDYLDYSAIRPQMAEFDAVYWAIGTSSIGVDEQTYARIHVDFPARFVSAWLEASGKPALSFHYISSSDISEHSRAMWAREKYRAERTLFALADNTQLRVIAYRPDYIRPTSEQAHIGQRLLYWFFAPVGAAVRAEQIGKAMFEVTARGAEFSNGDRIGTGGIRRYSDAWERRQAAGKQ